MHGGTIEARSAGVGEGATLTIRLPRISAPVRPVPSAPTLSAAEAPRRILIIEDNGDAREMLRAQLERGGHEVHAAADGPAGVESAAALPPDVVLIDVGLPGFDGYEVVRRIRATAWGKSIRLVALTGYGQADDRRRAREAGCDLHVTKPVMPERRAQILAGVTTSATPPMRASARPRPTISKRRASTSSSARSSAPLFFKGYADKKFKNFIQAASGAFGNAATRIEAFVAGGGTYVYGSYPDIDGLMQEQATMVDRQRREATLRRIQELVHDKAMFAPIWQLAFLNGVGPRVGESSLGLISGHACSAPYEDVTLRTP